MTDLPTGTVTFLFTDVEGSTRLWEAHAETMPAALAWHDEILRTAVEAHNGYVVKTTGDGLHAAFPTAHDAVGAALDAQRALLAETWSTPEDLRVRMGMHTGEAALRDGDYFGTAVNRAARVSGLAHGGQLIVSQSTEALLRDALADDVEVLDLGEHVLRDLSHTERVFQLWVAPLRRDFPALRSLENFPNNLPRRATSFVGRERELQKVAAALETAPVVTLTGVGGIGKTRLSLQVAAEVLPRYPDGVWLCELSAAADVDGLVQVVGSVLGVGTATGDRWHGIVEALRTRRLLLVLDNCEHLIEAASELAERIVDQCPDTTILATSREGLAVDGEQVVPLRPLGLPEPTDDFATIVATDSVRLFVERVRALQSDYEVQPVDREGVVELCRRLDGVPLAIELAAARAIAMSPGEIAGLLDERFRLLTGGRRTAVERHQTLRATVDWSYSLLDERDRKVFRRLGVFAGSVTAESAAVVVAGDGIERFDVLDALTSLVNKSMVVAERNDDGVTRYHMLETLRQYARERLEDDDDPDHWRRRHAEHYAAHAELLGPLLVSPDELAARRVLMADLDDLRAAVTWALDRVDASDLELGLRVITGLVVESSLRSKNGIGVWATNALPLLDRVRLEHAVAVNTAVAWIEFHRGDFAASLARAEGVVSAALDAPTGAVGSAYSVLGTSLLQLGRAADATERLHEGLERFRGAADPAAVMHQSTLLAGSSINSSIAGNPQRGLVEGDEALIIARQLRSPTAIALAQSARGRALADLDPAAAEPALEEAVALAEVGAMSAILTPSLASLAEARLRQGRASDARAPARQTLSLSREGGFDVMTIVALELVLRVLHGDGDTHAAAVVLGGLHADAIGPVTAVVLANLPEFPATAAGIRAALADDEFEPAHARGAAMDALAVIAFALEALG